MFNTEQSEQKWAPVLDHAEAPAFKDSYRRSVTAALLENQQKALKEERSMLAEADMGTGAIQNFDPILISLVRRAMPNLIAYDIAGVQPMSGPTGLIFALKPKYTSALTTTSGQTVAAGDDSLYGGIQGVTGGTAPTVPNGTSSVSLINGASYYTGTAASSASTTALTITATISSLQVGDLVIVQGAVAGTRVSSVSGTSVTLDTTPYQTIASGATITFANLAPIASAFSGLQTYSGTSPYLVGNALPTATGELLGTGGSNQDFATMGFDIEKTVVTANTRALKASYTMELAQDLKAVHGLDAESELANILSSEILFEINREVIETINAKAVLGARFNYTTAGVYDVRTDADGRWAAERYKSLHMAIELEANQIAKETRRGKGNFILCSSNVASALAAAGSLDYSPALSTKLEVDDTGNTFAGVLNGRIKVYIDPYTFTDYITVGYRGTNPYDAGIFYAPYVPLTMVRAIDPASFQPRIAFKTRYGVVANPFVQQINPAAASAQNGNDRGNFYYRTFGVRNISLRGIQAATS
jgi:Major capsid protein Gp23